MHGKGDEVLVGAVDGTTRPELADYFPSQGRLKLADILRSDPVQSRLGDSVRRSDVSPINLMPANRTGGTSDRHPLRGLGLLEQRLDGLVQGQGPERIHGKHVGHDLGAHYVQGDDALLAGSAGISHHYIDVVDVREVLDGRRRVARVAAFNLY